MATATKKKTVKKATKKTEKKTTVKDSKHGKGTKGGTKKATASSNGQARKTVSKLHRKQAEAIELTSGQYTVLQAIAKTPSGLSYKQIFNKTGIYNPLTSMCRPTHDGSLGTLGYINEEMHDINNRDTLVFKITANGKKALKKVSKIK